MLDLYCERLAPGLSDEPLNTASNLAFLAAAYALYRLPTDKKKAQRLLATLCCLVAIGSSLFHLFANSITLLLDVTPILALQILILSQYNQHFFKLSKQHFTLLIISFLLLTAAGSSFRDWLNGSAGYIPCLFILLALHQNIHLPHSAKKTVRLAGFALSMALIFRTIDLSVCHPIPIGTHFLWHCLSAISVFLSAKVALNNKPSHKA